MNHYDPTRHDDYTVGLGEQVTSEGGTIHAVVVVRLEGAACYTTSVDDLFHFDKASLRVHVLSEYRERTRAK